MVKHTRLRGCLLSFYLESSLPTSFSHFPQICSNISSGRLSLWLPYVKQHHPASPSCHCIQLYFSNTIHHSLTWFLSATPTRIKVSWERRPLVLFTTLTPAPKTGCSASTCLIIVSLINKGHLVKLQEHLSVLPWSTICLLLSCLNQVLKAIHSYSHREEMQNDKPKSRIGLVLNSPLLRSF